jgi:hypothetical protein
MQQCENASMRTHGKYNSAKMWRRVLILFSDFCILTDGMRIYDTFYVVLSPYCGIFAYLPRKSENTKRRQSPTLLHLCVFACWGEEAKIRHGVNQPPCFVTVSKPQKKWANQWACSGVRVTNTPTLVMAFKTL